MALNGMLDAEEESGGFDWGRGAIVFKGETKSGSPISAEFGFFSDFSASGAYYFEQNEASGAFEEWIKARIRGDLGAHLSYYFDIGIALLYVDRPYLGTYRPDVDSEATVKTFGSPSAYFPYTYRSSWDGWLFDINNLSTGGPTGWPNTVGLGFTTRFEISGSALDDIILFSFGRREREIAAMTEGSSLVLNKFAQPFWGIDLTIRPFSWFGIYSLTGILEYFDSDGIQESSKTFQNAFSITMFDINYKKYIHIDFGTTAVWPKRFELAYLFPLVYQLLYQNNVGDFDNIGSFADIKLQKPGLGFIWASFFLDEMNIADKGNIFILDREMYAYQAGASVVLPKLSFGKLTLSYTKIEPYCYTHNPLNNTPWYNGIGMEENYVNHGYGLGYYLPPNSDEIKLRFDMVPAPDTFAHAQFQMIRHGADYGASQVDGSSYWSQLSPDGRSEKPHLRKYFLHDGAYQWFYILKAGGKHKLKRLPVEFSAEAGIIISYWTDIINGSNTDGESHPYHIIDTAEYPKRTGIVMNLSISVFK